MQYLNYQPETEVLDSQDSLLNAIWKANWGIEKECTALLPDKIERDEVVQIIFGPSDSQNELVILTKYAYQSLYVGRPELYLKASLRAPRVCELSRKFNSADDVIEWIQNNIGTDSIFKDYPERIMLAD